jgi:HEAT repeats
MPAGTKRGIRKRLPVILLAVLGIAQAGCGGKSTGEWIEQLQSKNSAERLHAVNALGKRGREAEVVAPALAGALKDDDAFVRRDAAEALGELGAGAKPAFTALLVAARDKNAGVRQKGCQGSKTHRRASGSERRCAVRIQVRRANGEILTAGISSARFRFGGRDKREVNLPPPPRPLILCSHPRPTEPKGEEFPVIRLKRLGAVKYFHRSPFAC